MRGETMAIELPPEEILSEGAVGDIARNWPDEPQELRKKSNLRSGEKWAALLFLIPALAGFGIFWIGSGVRGLNFAFTDFNLLQDPNHVGLSNFREMINDPNVWNSLRVTALFAVVNVLLGTFLSLVTAALMQRLRLKTWVRSIMLLPWLVPGVAIALIWGLLLDANVGFINSILRRLGLPFLSFFNSSQAIWIIIGISVWSGLGYTALLLYAGMTQVPTDVYEAGAIDGASESRMFFSITLPLIRPIIALVLVLGVIGSLQVFDLVMIGYGGTPIQAVRVIFFYIFQQAFEFFRMGYASAVALLLVAIMGILTLIQMRVMRANESELS